MKTKLFLSSALVLVALFAVTAIGVGEASAANRGTIKNIFPPGNNGTSQGVGMIDGHDGNKYVFQTPGDNGGKELEEGDKVFFEPSNGRKVDSVTQETSSPIGEAGSKDLVDSYIEMPPRDIDKPFLMPIEDGFSITGIGTVATGRIETGVINSGETIDILGMGAEMFRKILDRGEAGDNVRGGHTIGAGIVAEIVKGIDSHNGENGDTMPPEERIKKQEGTITIMKRLPEHSLGVIELRMKTGTVKFFNEKKIADSNSEDSLTDAP